MNNTCPSCGAQYNVAAKDIGRRIKCKKCGTPLIVAESGLEVDDPDAIPRPEPVPPAADAADEFEDEDDRPRRGRGRDRDRGRRTAGPGFNPLAALAKIGGIPTILFGFGAFLVIVFLFMPIIGHAAVERAQGAVERVDLQWKTKEREMRKEKKSEEDITKAREDFYKKKDKEALDEDVGYERIGNKRSRWFEMYGMMFGFLLLMVGSIGYMMPEQTTVRRILGTIVLGTQVIIIFIIFAASGGGCAGRGGGGPPVP